MSSARSPESRKGGPMDFVPENYPSPPSSVSVVSRAIDASSSHF
jgi:hypothetical protein